MGIANWVVGRMVDAFLAQPPKEKAAVFETMATKFWDAATPEETLQIAQLLLPRFLEHFLGSASTEQKLELMRGLVSEESLAAHVGKLLPSMLQAAVQGMGSEEKQAVAREMLDPSQLRGMASELLPTLLKEALGAMGPEDWRKLMPEGFGPMGGMGMPGMPGPGGPPPKQEPPRPSGGMMPW